MTHPRRFDECFHKRDLPASPQFSISPFPRRKPLIRRLRLVGGNRRGQLPKLGGMPYYVRPELPGSVQHLITRFANGEFRIAGDVERLEYLRRAALVVPRVDLVALAYAVMSSHVHWATLAGLDPPWRFMLPINGPFARWLNIRQGRSGPVLMERFRLLVFEGEKLAELLAYLHNNPVRAGVVSDPADSSWSSHRAYIGDVAAPPWLDVERGLSLAGFDASAAGRVAFHDYVRSRAGLPREPAFSGATLDDERAAVRRTVGSAAEAGAGVVTEDESGVAIVHRPNAAVGAAWNGDGLDLLRAVCAATGLSLATLCSRSRRPRVVRARRLALVVWSRHLRRHQRGLLALLGLSSTSGSRLLAADDEVADLMEEARELLEALTAQGLLRRVA